MRTSGDRIVVTDVTAANDAQVASPGDRRPLAIAAVG